MMNKAAKTTTHTELANKVLDNLRQPPSELPPIEMEETRKNNAARCMGHLFCNRLSLNGEAPAADRAIQRAPVCEGTVCYSVRTN